MNQDDGDFKYNGVPIFEVGFLDFYTFVNCLENNNRVLSRNIHSDRVREFYKSSRTNQFGLCYEGVIIDLRTFKNK